MTRYINIKPLERSRVYETAEQAIGHLFLYPIGQSDWNDARPWGHTVTDIRRINAARKAKDFSAFKAEQRRGYWRVELAN